MAEKETSPEKAAPLEKNSDEKAESPETVQEQEEKQSYLKDLMAISGYGGLFKFVSQARNGVIVESLETGKRMNAFATMKVSALEDIAIYTEEKEIPLEEVLIGIHQYENGEEAISPKSDPDELKDYFAAVLPAYDRERVYVSDIKKVLSWYNLLLKYDLLRIEEEKPAGKKAGAAAAAGEDPAAKAGTAEEKSSEPGKSDPKDSKTT
jgi:hypothetical protein